VRVGLDEPGAHAGGAGVGYLQMEDRIPMTAVEREGIDDDLFSASAIDDPYTYLARLRQTDPVHWNEMHHVWIVTRYDDVVHLTSHPELFSSAIVNTEQPPYPPIAEDDAEELKFVRSNVRRRLTHLDPPEHAAKRRAIRPFFNPHVGFGRGMHACLGAPLARLEAQEVFKEFASRFPGFALVNDRIEYMPAADLRVPKNVVVTW
jgi:cytochrome P450